MAWFAVNEDGTEIACNNKLFRLDSCWIDASDYSFEPYAVDTICCLPKGSIERLIGVKITWEDEPIEVKHLK